MGLVLSVPTVLMGLSRSLHIINTSNSCKVSEDTEGADVSELIKTQILETIYVGGDDTRGKMYSR